MTILTCLLNKSGCVPENHECDHAATLWTNSTQPHKGNHPPPSSPPRDWWEKWNHTQALFFSARELMLYPEIFSEHLTQNFSELMCLLEYRLILTQLGLGWGKIFNKLPDDTDATSPQTTRPLWLTKVLSIIWEWHDRSYLLSASPVPVSERAN